jgi:hypothetical protein
VILDNAIIQYKDELRTALDIHEQHEISLRMFDPAETLTPISPRDIVFFTPAPGSQRMHHLVENVGRELLRDPGRFPHTGNIIYLSRFTDLVSFAGG